VNSTLTKPFFSAALFILLSAVILPGKNSHFSSKGVNLADPFSSVAGIQNNNHVGKPDGDDQKINRTPDGLITLPTLPYITPSPNPVPGSTIAYTVHQARAPPQF
jgi:hypothetical protein